MPRQTNGSYVAPGGTAAVSGQLIASAAFNTLETDIGSEITNSLDRLGRGAMQANLTMGAYRIVTLADPVNPQDAVTLNYLNAIYSASPSKVIAWLGYTPANKAGDNFTGNVNILNPTASGVFGVYKNASGNYSQVIGGTGVLTRWAANLGDNTAEGGSNAGSNFAVARYNDAGTYIDTPFTISRQTGLAAFNDGLTVAGGLAASGTTTAPTVASTDNSGNVATTAFVNGAVPLVIAAIASLAVGTYAVAQCSVNTAVGATTAGSGLTMGGANGGAGATGAGTWRHCGALIGTTSSPIQSLFLRIA